MGLRAVVDVVLKRKLPRRRRVSNPRISIVQPRRWEGNNKMDLKQIMCQGVASTYLSHNSVQWWDYFETVTSLRVQKKKRRISWPIWRPSDFQEGPCFMGLRLDIQLELFQRHSQLLFSLN
jgi:hypothetical protein